MIDYSKDEFEETITEFTHEIRIRFPNRTNEKPLHELYRGSSAFIRKTAFILAYAAGIVEQNGCFGIHNTLLALIKKIESKVKGQN